MTSSIQRAPLRLPEYSNARQRQLEHQLKRFPKRYRAVVCACAHTNRALADLAFSFPALLFVIAVPHGKFDGLPIKQLVIEGQSFKKIASVAKLPLWTRKLVPEAFEQSLGMLPHDEISARQIVNHLPRRRRHAAAWLRFVQYATEWGDACFAVWLAKQLPHKHLYDNKLHKLCLWAWFSLRPKCLGHQHITKRWSADIKLKAALEASSEWYRRVYMSVMIAEAELENLWLQPAIVDGYQFEPLLNAKAIHEEASAMDNCVHTYAEDIAMNRERLWSMRRDGKRVATLSIGNNYDLGLLSITQIKGARNEKVKREEAVAAVRWFNSFDTLLIEIKEKDWDSTSPNIKAWQSLFKPYWIEKRRVPAWLPLRPTARCANLH